MMNLKERAIEILEIQKEFIIKLQVADSWIKCIEIIRSVTQKKARIITTGMGKAGIIANKMSATLASLGISSFYIHPAESLHGDLGRISSDDIVVVFSHSGTTMELRRMITYLHNMNDHKNTVILISGGNDILIPHDHLVPYGEIVESSIVEKVPSTSTTIMLIIADVIAITTAESLGFNKEWFKIRHPGGAIGQSYKKGEKH